MKRAIARILRAWADELDPLPFRYESIDMPATPSMADEVTRMLAERERELAGAQPIGNVDFWIHPPRAARASLRRVK